MVDIFQDNFRDFIQALNDQQVSYILVGGFAAILHGHARVTGDLDIWVERAKLSKIAQIISAISHACI